VESLVELLSHCQKSGLAGDFFIRCLKVRAGRGTSAGTVSLGLWQAAEGTERPLTCLGSTEPGYGTPWSRPAACRAGGPGTGRQPWSQKGLTLFPPDNRSVPEV